MCVSSIIKKLHALKYQKILIEGGAKTASSFLNKGYCDFMYIYKAKSFVGSKGLHAFDTLKDNISFFLYNEVKLRDNKLEFWMNNNLKKFYKRVI